MNFVLSTFPGSWTNQVSSSDCHSQKRKGLNLCRPSENGARKRASLSLTKVSGRFKLTCFQLLLLLPLLLFQPRKMLAGQRVLGEGKSSSKTSGNSVREGSACLSNYTTMLYTVVVPGGEKRKSCSQICILCFSTPPPQQHKSCSSNKCPLVHITNFRSSGACKHGSGMVCKQVEKKFPRPPPPPALR